MFWQITGGIKPAEIFWQITGGIKPVEIFWQITGGIKSVEMSELIELLRMASLIVIVCLAVCEDAKSYRIPNEIIAVGGGSACLLAIIGLVVSDGIGVPVDICMGGVEAFALALALYVCRCLGAGDAKLIAVCGMFVGRQNAAAMVAMSVTGGMIGGIVEMITGSGRILGVKRLHGTHFSIGIFAGCAMIACECMQMYK